MKFCLATHNSHKVTEFKRILEPLGIEIVTPAIPEVEETGKTFFENAELKAKSAYLYTGLPSVADDSGLCVDYLDGAPGIYSARFSESGNDEDNNKKLLELLRGVPKEKRGAHYVCAIVLYDGEKTVTALGECYGTIAEKPQGNGGFGYDPLFISEIGCFGEVTPAEKDSISHRAKALKDFSQKLKEINYVNK